MARIRLVLLFTIIAVGSLTGCNTQTAGTATPATDAPETTETSSSQEEPPDDGAPKVDDPLDASKFEDDPCLTLNATQSGDIGLGTTGTPTSATLGKACTWENASTRSLVQIKFYSEIDDGLSAEYRAQEDDKWAFFEALQPIDGFPAVTRDITDNRDNGTCPVVVGLSDELAFEVDLRLPEENIGKEDPCEAAAEVAGMAVQTMKNG